MSDLRLTPTASSGKVQDITPERAGWGYVGFGLYRLAPGETASEATGTREAILVVLEGKAEISAVGQEHGEMGDRAVVFERTPPHCLYVPGHSDWTVRATTDCVLAVCTAPWKDGTGYPVGRIGPDVGRF